MNDLRTETARIRGLGSSHHGTGTWIKERVTSVALIPLSLWGLWSAYDLAGAGYEGAVAWLQVPLNAVLLGLLVLVALQHMHLGLRVVIEDYIHRTTSKAILLLLNLFVCAVLAAAATFSILKVALSGGLGA